MRMMALRISSMALEPLLSSEAMMLKRCHLPQTEGTDPPVLLDQLQERRSDNVLRGGETREHGVNVDATQLGRVRLERQLRNGVLQRRQLDEFVQVARSERISMPTRLPFR